MLHPLLALLLWTAGPISPIPTGPVPPGAWGPAGEPGPAGAQEPATPPTVTLPGEPAGRTWAAVGPETLPAELATADLPAHPTDARWWSTPTWRRWSDALSAEAAADVPSAERRAELALLALAGGRTADAWRHWERTVGDPSVAAAVLPAFLPGLARDALPELTGPGGVPRPLPDGVRLEPALPPPVDGAPAGRLERRSMRIADLRIGEAVCAITVRVENEGVQIDMEHTGGAAAEFEIVVPEPEGFELGSVYLDWYRQEAGRGPHRVQLGPDLEEPRVLFARCRPRTPGWPTRLPEELPAQALERGIAIVAPTDDDRAGGLAQALAEVLGIPASAGPRDAAPEGALVIDLDGDGDEARKLFRVLSMAERHLLR